VLGLHPQGEFVDDGINVQARIFNNAVARNHDGACHDNSCHDDAYHWLCTDNGHDGCTGSNYDHDASRRLLHGSGSSGRGQEH
jgi:hypothetical protein